jgi:uncharacterized protein (TIGR02284 family)
MSTNNEKTCGVLNDLIKINHDRVEGYNRAKEEVDPSNLDLINTFDKMINQSSNYIADLGALVTKYGGTIATDSTVMGSIYRTWMDVKTAFSADKRQNALNSCEFGEDAAQKAYKSAMEEDDMGEEARSLIAIQKNSLKDSHDLIKEMRDREKAHADH